MSASIPSQDTAADPVPVASPYSGFVKAWLGVDLALCIAVGLFAMAATVPLLRGEFGGYTASLAIAKVVAQYGVATLGILGDVLLLRRRRAGYWFGCMALACTGAGIVLVFQELQVHLAGVEAEQAAGFVAGVVLVVCCRGAVNLVYACALRSAWRALRAAGPTMP